MEEGKSQVCEESWTFNYGNNMKNHDQNREHEDCISSSESCVEDSAFSNESLSSSSFDTTDDASSSPSSSLSTNSSAALYDLTDLMEQLPIKRGLSKFYNGKSESFTSLSMVTSIEDLVKKGAPYKRKMKASKSYAAGLNSYKPYTLPKPVISKKPSKVSLLPSSPTNKRGNVMAARAR